MGKQFVQAAWTLVAVVAGSVAAGGGVSVVAVVALALAAVGVAVQSRWVQQRVPFLQTEKQKLASYYDSCYDLWSLHKRQRSANELEAWDMWGDRVREWDRDFWAYMQRTRDDWRPRKREVLDPPGKEFANWSEIVRQGLEQRLALIKDLLAE